MAKKPEPPPLSSWDVYKIAKKSVWLGTVEAPDKAAAIEKAAQEFKTVSESPRGVNEGWCVRPRLELS